MNRKVRFDLFFRLSLQVAGLFLTLALGGVAGAQTASTGAISGVVSDVNGGVVPGATIRVTNKATGETREVTSRGNGGFLASLLAPGLYTVEASKENFKKAQFNDVAVVVSETNALNIGLEVGQNTEVVIVYAEENPLQTTSSALGHITDEHLVDTLPLVTRNYTQILGLSPGVSGDVTNAASIGRGDTSQSASTGGYSVAGSATNDNNFQMNGAEVNDLEGEGNISGGVPVPNPDSIQEFKVQTGQYDASYGRNGGANVDVVTKSGTNQFHGDVWEYFRNTALNANDFFLNLNKQPRGVLDQNQFGFTFGGPFKKDRLMFFTSYQGTRERDGLSVGCLSSGALPVGLTNEASSRTAQALATEFNGVAGLGGVVSASDPGAISPTALAVLNAQLPNGSFVVPAPQNPNATGATNTTFSSPCRFNEDQFITNLDWLYNSKSHLSGKFFWANSTQPAAFPNNQLGVTAITVPGFPQSYANRFYVFTLTHTYTINEHFLNQAIIGFHRLEGQLGQSYPNVKFANSGACTSNTAGPFTLASICVPAPGFDNPYPSVVIPGAFNVGGNGQGVGQVQNSLELTDQLSYNLGRHSLEFGGGFGRNVINFEGFHFLAGLLYPTFADFLLGNVLGAIDVPGVFDRAWKVWLGNAYVQDNLKVTPRLTVNAGLRYERQGALGEYLGRSSTFDPTIANPNPPASGTLQGFIVASNFSGGTIPPGVIQASTNTAINNDGQNTWSPRLGFSWQLPHTNRVLLRGGYGIYYTRTTGEPFIQLLGAPPWGIIRQMGFTSLLSPDTAFPPAPPFPIFTPYAPTTDLTPTVFSRHFRPPIGQNYSLGLQTELAANWILEVGYRGTRGTKLLNSRSFNQAEDATVNPIRGQTENTLANIPLRVPIVGFDPAFSTYIESAGASWYNSLETSLSKRFSHGLQFLASYTWASALQTNPGYTTGAFAGGTLIGNQTDQRSSYGFDSFVHPQRFIVSYVYEFPSPQKLSWFARKVLGGWSLAGVTTIQSGHRLTLTNTNSTSVFGIVGTNQDRVQLAPGCKPGNAATSGAVTNRLNNYFNPSCITAPSIIGADGIGTAFGNSGIGIVSGPDQRDFDISILKKTTIGPSESKNVEFRAEFFNAFNTPSFSDPVTSAGQVAPGGLANCTPGSNPANPACVGLAFSPNFGTITSTSVSPRIIQLALKFYF